MRPITIVYMPLGHNESVGIQSCLLTHARFLFLSFLLLLCRRTYQHSFLHHHFSQITMRSLTVLVGLVSLATTLGNNNGYRTNGKFARVGTRSAAAHGSLSHQLHSSSPFLPAPLPLPSPLPHIDNLQSRAGPNRTDECPFYFNTSPSSNTVSLYACVCRSSPLPPPLW